MKVENVTHAYCGAKDPGPAHVKHALLFFLKCFIISSHFSIWSCLLVKDETFSLSHFIVVEFILVLLVPPPGTTKLLLFIFLVFFVFFKTKQRAVIKRRERTRESKSSFFFVLFYVVKPFDQNPKHIFVPPKYLNFFSLSNITLNA